MAPLTFTCPNTKQRASTGIQTDVQSLHALWKVVLKVNCPFCGEVHEISVRETFISGAIFDTTNRESEAEPPPLASLLGIVTQPRR